MQRTTGEYVETTTAGETVKAFVPKPLPPEPALALTTEIEAKLQKATARLSELRVASHLVPSPEFFNYSFVRKEAVLSSQIEGVQATLADLLNYEADPETFQNADLQEVCNYLDALQFGRRQLRDPKGLPLSLRLIQEMHQRLMRGVRGASKQPGEFRSSQNWIGGARPSIASFVPPPNEMKKCLEQLESYLHQDSETDALIRIALIHAQFETIHPFLDGNGRLGRLLIALLFEAWDLLDARLLYLSLHFKRNQQEYYRRLDEIRFNGNWEAWIDFFLEGICSTSQEAIQTSQDLFQLFEKDRKRLLSHSKAVIPAVRLFEELPSNPVLTVGQVVKLLQTTKPTAAKAIEILCDLGVLEETTGGKRNRFFGYKKYLSILKADAQK